MRNGIFCNPVAIPFRFERCADRPDEKYYVRKAQGGRCHHGRTGRMEYVIIDR